MAQPAAWQTTEALIRRNQVLLAAAEAARGAARRVMAHAKKTRLEAGEKRAKAVAMRQPRDAGGGARAAVDEPVSAPLNVR